LSDVKVPPADLAERLWAVSDQVLAPGPDIRIDDLAELAGVPRATLYYYFSGKDDVFAFLLAQKLQRGTEAITAAAHSPGSAVQKLEAVLRAMLHTMAEHPELCTRLLSGTITQGTGGQLMVEVERTLMAPVRDLLAEAKASGELVVGNPADTTLSLMGAVAIVAMVRTATDTFDPDEVADWLIPQFLNGLCPRDRTQTRPRTGSRTRRPNSPR
jgi:AcrR family transcriptional regulator